MRLRKSVKAVGDQAFAEIFAAELSQVSIDELPLQAGLERSSYVATEPFKVIVLGYDVSPQHIVVRAGISYSGLVAGCSCADDPTPQDLVTEYCEITVTIDRLTAVGEAELAGFMSG